MKHLFTFLSLLFFFSACHTNYEPQRAKGIPQNAAWIGGVDGGKWIVIKTVYKKQQRIDAEIFNDQSGDLEANGLFQLACDNDKNIKWDDMVSQINGSTEGEIYLTITGSDNKNCTFKKVTN